MTSEYKPVTTEEHEAALLECEAAKLAHEQALAEHREAIEVVGAFARQTLKEVAATLGAWRKASQDYIALVERDPFAGIATDDPAPM